jgi:hypothetical protein
MDIGDEEEGGVDRLDALSGLAEGHARKGAGDSEASHPSDEGAARNSCWRRAIHRHPIKHPRTASSSFNAAKAFHAQCNRE